MRVLFGALHRRQVFFEKWKRCVLSHVGAARKLLKFIVFVARRGKGFCQLCNRRCGS
jgi:hypothetical protein